MLLYREISKEVERLTEFSDYDYSEVSKLLDEAGKVSAAWSGSWLGYHSCVYYENLEVPPPGAHFSTEWGLHSGNEFIGMGCTGNWVEYEF